MGAFAAGRLRKKQLKEREKNSIAFLHILRECSTQLEAVWQAEDDARARRRLNELRADDPETFAAHEYGRRERRRRKRSRKLAKVEGIIVSLFVIAAVCFKTKLNRLSPGRILEDSSRGT
jgi:predicted nucleic acid-binding protein